MTNQGHPTSFYNLFQDLDHCSNNIVFVIIINILLYNNNKKCIV